MNNNQDDIFDLFGVEKPKENNKNISKLDENNSVNLEEKEKLKPEVEEKINPEEQKEIIPQEPTLANQDNVDKKELLKLYIGPNYENIMYGGYSYLVLFLGGYYLFYRKQYKYAFSLLALSFASFVSFCFLQKSLYTLFGFICFIACFLLGAIFKKQYVSDAEAKIDEILKSEGSIEEKKNKIKTIGGVDKRVYVFLIVYIVICFAIERGSFYFLQNNSSSAPKLHFPEEFKAYQEDLKNSYTSYKLGKYQYSESSFTYRSLNNVCKYQFKGNNEFVSKDKKIETARRYLKEKHTKEGKLNKVTYGNNTYFYYYDEKTKEAYYIYITEKGLTEIYVEYIKDTDKECHENTEYILKNLERN